MTDRSCENCATPETDLVAVRRVYVAPESWDSPACEQVLDEVEWWCVSCWSQYPSVPATAPPSNDPA